MIQRKALKSAKPLDTCDRSSPIQQQNARVPIDSRLRDDVATVACDDPDLEAVVTGANIDVCVPRRVRQHHLLVGLGRRVEFDTCPNEARQPHVSMLA